jgi:hypothetical protein
LLQRLPVVGRTAHGSVQADAIAVGTQRLVEAGSLDISPGSINTFWPARGPKAMR